MTLKDIADLANTSVSTVSRSLNDSDLVAEETKQRIKAIAMARGYEFNAMARGLATSTIGTIGVILPENYDRFDVLLYHAALHNDLRKSLERADLDVIVAFEKNRFSGRHNIEKLVTRKKVDGLIIVQSELEPETVHFLQERGTPFVLTQYPPLEAEPGYHMVYSDNWTGGKLVAEHFAEQGFRSIVCITGGRERQSLQRIAGFRETLRLRGIDLKESNIFDGDWRSESAVGLVEEHLSLFKNADAVFAVNDLMAFGALQALGRSGLSIPDDIAVAGYDDTPLASATIPALTSVHQAHEEIALLASELLFDLIAERAAGEDGRTGSRRAGGGAGEGGGGPGAADGTAASAPRAIAIQPRLAVRESTKSVNGGGGDEGT